ncbi:putative GTP-binding protein [Corallococcus coralloides]|uniref:Putative GTP-binding protein n=1 Tax=Corallococcus coralloides TaxID=184914 RepID=A0A410S4C9_CORCK|nr:putative GTP-binding protein [Corallococcus coralloides]
MSNWFERARFQVSSAWAVLPTRLAGCPNAREQARIGEVYEHTTVVSQAYDETGSRLRVRGLPGAIARLTRSFQE